MARLDFSIQTARKITTRTKPTKYDKSLLRNIFRDLGPGDSLSDVYYPYKYLTAQMKDVTTEDYIVIPKGRIVSLLTHYEQSTPVSGIPTPSGASSIYQSVDASSATTGIITALIDGDNSFYGYPNHVAGLLVPANGGVDCSGQYTSRDVDAGFLQGVTAASAAVVITKNIPIGVVPGDVYQDVRGRWNNYQMFDKAVAVVTDWYIEVPFVRIPGSKAGNLSYDPSAPEDPLNFGSTVFGTMNSKYTYMTFDTDDLYQTGRPVMSDIRGNYKLAYSGTAVTATTPVMNAQCIGKLVLIDCRYPKDNLELVDTYEGSNMPGTSTAGIPSHIFNFAHDYLSTMAVSHRLTDVVAAIQGGQFGGARILINV